MWIPERAIKILGEIFENEGQRSEELVESLIQCDNLTTLLSVVSSSNAATLTTKEVLEKSNYRDQLYLLPKTHPDFKTKYGGARLRGFTPPPAIEQLQQYFINIAESKCFVWPNT